ncbi:MAG: FAD-dependent oxidoreductase, partial [Bacillota bacterium]
MAKKVGVYICKGCGIGEALDVDALAKVASKEYKAPVVKTCDVLCAPEGIELIKQDLAGEGVNLVVIAGCSARVNYDHFDFGPEILVERVNLREQVVWTQPPDDEDTQMMAEDYMRMTLAKTKNLELPEPFIGENLSKAILVVGGGLAGMTAALEAANAGHQVILVEKESALGGWLNKVYKIAPLAAPFTELQDPDVEARVQAINDNPRIKVYT